MLGVRDSVPLVEVERSGVVESVHIGAAAIVSPGGRVTRIGGADALIYPRSALKPFQTIAALGAGARLTGPELVIVTSSHVGSARHVELVDQVLAGAGLDRSALRTPAAWPVSGTEARSLAVAGGRPSAILMGCSGNHAGMLAGAAAAGWPTDDYLHPTHPIHALAATVIEESTGTPPTQPGTDGCGGPVWAIPLAGLAIGFQRVLADHPSLSAAIRANPEVIEGAGTPTTEAIRTLGVVAKSGAEGVWMAVAADGTAIAVKTLDGGHRAGAIVGVELLARVGSVDRTAADAFLGSPQFAVRGGGSAVGRLRVIATP